MNVLFSNAKKIRLKRNEICVRAIKLFRLASYRFFIVHHFSTCALQEFRFPSALTLAKGQTSAV